jgi:LysM repeat protein
MNNAATPSAISSINFANVMNPHTLPVKRRKVVKGIFKRLSAVTGARKQRVAATAPSELEAEDNGSKISRALTIIFLIHIVAIGLIFVHQTFLDGRSPELAKSGKPEAAVATRRVDLPRMASGEKPYVVMQGDNYARIAAAAQVEEADLRLINKHVEIVPGLLLSIPPKRIVAVDPPEVAAIRSQTPSDSNRGLVEALPVDVSGAPRAQLVRPNPNRNVPVSAAAASGKSYVVQNGDSVYRIANKFKVNQNVLMKANGISDPRKMKTGMTLVIPN